LAPGNVMRDDTKGQCVPCPSSAYRSTRLTKRGHDPEIPPFDTVTDGHAEAPFPMLMS